MLHRYILLYLQIKQFKNNFVLFKLYQVSKIKYKQQIIKVYLVVEDLSKGNNIASHMDVNLLKIPFLSSE